MYQYRYNQKKRQSKGPKILAIILAIGVLVGAIYFLPKIGSQVEDQQTNSNSTTSNIFNDWYVGKEVLLSGDITATGSASSSYSHVLTLEDKGIVYLNSSTLDLHNYNGYVYIKGNVSKYDGKNWIVNVAAIGNSTENMQSVSVPASTGTTILPQAGLKIDMTNDSSIAYTLQDGKVELTTDGFSGSVVVTAFRCETGMPGKDCDALKSQYTEEGFTNGGGLVFTKSGTNWFGYNPAGAGLLVTSSSDSLFYKVSRALVPINETYIKGLLPNIIKMCNMSSNAPEAKITKNTLAEWNVTIGACTSVVTIDENGENISIKTPGSTNTTPTNTGSTTTNPTIPAETPKPDSISTTPTTTASGYTFTSTRGNYAINFPSAKISFSSENVTESLGVAGLSCYVRIDIKNWADRENANVGPGAEIYECTSKTQPTVAGYTMKASADGTKLFYIRSLDASWNDFTNGITIN